MKRTPLGFGVLLSAGLAFHAVTSSLAAERPNILWLSAEDMSLNLGCYGDRSARYWAAAGLHALRSEGRPALANLKAAMADPAASVRIEAAWAVAEQDSSAAALTLLAKELDNPNERAACRAARALELLGEKARPHLEATQQALTRAGSVHYAFGFSLQTAVQNLTRKP